MGLEQSSSGGAREAGVSKDAGHRSSRLRRKCMPDLRPLLSPDSVAIIGAAADSSLRGRLTQQLVEHGFDGRIYPVTRSHKEVLGHKAYAAVGDIPEAADLAIILVPAAYVVSTIEQCAARGIPAAVVISSGFAEEKSEEAAARDQALR